jgi:hypothetical protein
MKHRIKLEASPAYALETSMCIYAVLITITWEIHILYAFINICNIPAFDVPFMSPTLGGSRTYQHEIISSQYV